MPGGDQHRDYRQRRGTVHARRKLQRLQDYYIKQGCLPEVVANDVVKAVQTGKPLVLTGPYSRLLYHLKRLSRRLLFKITLSTAPKVGYL